MNKITNIILSLRKKWKKQGFTPFQINNGNCDIFANEVITKLGGYSDILYDVCTENFVKFGELIGHIWITYKGKYYDVECPNGVKDWKKLPIFNREKIK